MNRLRRLTGLFLATQAVAFGPAPGRPHAGPVTVGVDDGSITRRMWFLKTASSAVLGTAFLPSSTHAAEKLENYQSAALGFQILIPVDWEKITQRLPDRRSITLFVDPTSGEEKTLMFIAKTPIQPDFTSLASFGSVDQVAQTTILPKGEFMGQTTASVMLSSESKKNAYYFDYKVTPPNLPETHYRVIFALTNSILVTLTIQTPESRYSEMKPMFDEMINSFGKFEG